MLNNYDENYIGKQWYANDPIYLFGDFRVYPFTMMMGIIASIISIMYFWRKNKFPIEILLTLIIITVPSAIIGARLFFIIESAIRHDDLSRWYAIWDGGLSIQGGVILPTILDLIYAQRKRNIIDIKKAFGIILPNVLLGQCIGRWGNFTNHEIFGPEVSYDSISWLGSAIAQNMYIEGSFKLPLFLIESFLSFVGYILIVWIFLQFNIFKPGTTGGLYLIWYGLIRIILEPLRDAIDYRFIYIVLSAVFIFIGLILVIYFEITGRKIYQKQKISRFSFYYLNMKKPIVVSDTYNKWINE